MDNITMGEFWLRSLVIRVSFEMNNMQSMEDFDEEHKGTLLHEYIHYLQMISLPSLLNYFTVSSKIIQLYLHMIGESGKSPFKVPIDLDSLVEKDFNFATLAAQKLLFDLHFQFQNKIDIEPIIQNVAYEKDTFYYKYVRKIIKNEKYKLYLYRNTRLVSLNYWNGSIKPQKYYLDAYTIMESMAYLIETEMYRSSLHFPTFPYKICSMVCEFIYPDFTKETWRIIALCEVSLMSFTPGACFYELLNLMKKSHFMPKKLEEFIKFISAYVCDNNIDIMPINLWKEVTNIINVLYPSSINNNHVDKTRLWLLQQLNHSFMLRQQNPLFITTLVYHKTKWAREMYLAYLFQMLSVPPIIDKHHDVFNLIGEDEIYVLIVLQSFHRLFDTAQIYRNEKPFQCVLFDICKHNNHPAFDDTICSSYPWKQVEGIDGKLCIFAIYWHHFSLSGIELRI